MPGPGECAWAGGCLVQGVCAWSGGGVCLVQGGLPGRGVCLSALWDTTTPPPNDKQVQKYYLDQNFVAAGNKNAFQ